jgi:chromosome segregation ATPase
MATKPNNDEILGRLLENSEWNRSNTERMATKLDKIDTDVTDLRVGMAEVKGTLDNHSEKLEEHRKAIDSGRRKIDEIEQKVHKVVGAEVMAESVADAIEASIKTPLPIVEKIDKDGEETLFKLTTTKKVMDAVKHPAVSIPGGVGIYEAAKEFLLPVLKALFVTKGGGSGQ